ncbi:serine/threonine protein kinase [Nocardiopsis sp. L17-MgMaSL7]|nr:serine/threonine protein kinase [Nocardiopsis sp. L17-MgMaSL7]
MQEAVQSGAKTPDGRYTFVDRLGGGGMGEVWLARDERFGRYVAVKFLLEEHQLTKDSQGEGWNYQELERRFLREAQVMALLDHPGIPAVFDWCMDPGEEFKRRYIVMQRVEGKTVGALLEEHHSLAVEEAACLAAQVCSVLATAHDMELVHRDLKPSNLMVDRSGMVRVLDFGIAILTDENFTRMTRSSQGSPGTTGYMAPEVRTNESPGVEASDLYALGCVMYEVLGGPVFTGTTDQITAAHLKETPEPLRERNPNVPENLGALVDQMLLKVPEERPSGAREVYDRLRIHIPQPGFRGRGSFDLTRPFVDPWRPLPRERVKATGFRVPPTVIDKPKVTNSSVAAELRDVEQLWEAGRRQEALAATRDLLSRAKDALTDEAKPTLKAGIAYASMLKEDGRGSQASEELRNLLNGALPKRGENDPLVSKARKLLEETEQ